MINVLIVDDDPMVAELNRCYLEQVPGFQWSTTVTTLSKAQEILKNRVVPVDLVLLDIYMQQENGLDLLPVLRELSEEIGVIIISSANDTQTIKRALGYGIVDYLIKPFQFGRFQQALLDYRQEVELLKQQQFCVQSDVDNLLHRSATVVGEPELPKGVTEITLRRICDWILNQCGNEPFSTEQLAVAVGISRVSCRKYLIYMTESGILLTTNLYGSAGRPVYLYRVHPAKLHWLKEHSGESQV
jgi:two-component system response regulator DcuR